MNLFNMYHVLFCVNKEVDSTTYGSSSRDFASRRRILLSALPFVE